MSKVFGMILIGAAWLAIDSAAEEKAKNADTLAKAAAARFMEAMKAEDITAVMKVVEVPFFWDGVKNIKDREELKEGFAKVFAEKDLTQLEYAIKEIHPFSKGLKKFREKDQKLLKEIMSGDDRIVLVALKRDGVAVMVRIREGKAKVGGFRD